jgi:hypothetical protein
VTVEPYLFFLHADILLNNLQHLVNNSRLKFQHLLSSTLYCIVIIFIIQYVCFKAQFDYRNIEKQKTEQSEFLNFT